MCNVNVQLFINFLCVLAASCISKYRPTLWCQESRQQLSVYSKSFGIFIVNIAYLCLQVNRGSLIFETDNDQQVSSWTTELKECISNRWEALKHNTQTDT